MGSRQGPRSWLLGRRGRAWPLLEGEAPTSPCAPPPPSPASVELPGHPAFLCATKRVLPGPVLLLAAQSLRFRRDRFCFPLSSHPCFWASGLLMSETSLKSRSHEALSLRVTRIRPEWINPLSFQNGRFWKKSSGVFEAQTKQSMFITRAFLFPAVGHPGSILSSRRPARRGRLPDPCLPHSGVGSRLYSSKVFY